jgi:hypothetical protein
LSERKICNIREKNNENKIACESVRYIKSYERENILST